MELEQKFAQLESQLQAYFAKMAEEQKNTGSALTETKSGLELIKEQIRALTLQAANPGGSEQKTLSMMLKENESLQRLMRDGVGTAKLSLPGLQMKTTITSSAISASGADHATSGVVNYERIPGIVPLPRRRLFVQDLLTEIPTTAAKIDYVKIENDVDDASPQVEGELKHENAMSFTTAEASVRTIATTIPATKQILDDFDGLEAILRSSLDWAVRKEEEDQIIAGSNTGQDLNGLLTQATAFDTALMVASDGWEYADQIGRAIQQQQTNNYPEADFVAINPAIWWGIRLQKNDGGDYIYGNPTNGAGNYGLFGLRVIPTNALSSAQFLVGSSEPAAAHVRRRMGVEVAISTEHSDFFARNMVMIRAESRLALVVMRPDAAIKGTFTQSPA